MRRAHSLQPTLLALLALVLAGCGGGSGGLDCSATGTGAEPSLTAVTAATTIDDGTMLATVPPGSAGLVAVRVQTPFGEATLDDAFAYRAPLLFFAIHVTGGIRLFTHAPGTGSYPQLGVDVEGYRLQSMAMAPDGILMVAAIKLDEGARYYFDVDQGTGAEYRDGDAFTQLVTVDTDTGAVIHVEEDRVHDQDDPLGMAGNIP